VEPAAAVADVWSTTMKTFVVTAVVLACSLGMGLARASEQIATKAGCATCHAVDKKIIGPSYKDIAAKYKGKPDAVAALSKSVRTGSKGVWGTLPMAPTDAAKLSDADLKTVITWVLKTPS
jgi:cytochrome c